MLPRICLLPILIGYALVASAALCPKQWRFAAWLPRAWSLTVLLHTAYLALSLIAHGAQVLQTHQESLTVMSWVTALLALWLMPRAPRGPLILAAQGLAALLLAVAFFGPMQQTLPAISIHPALVALHVFAAWVAVAVFLLGGVIAIFYLVAERALKTHRLMRWWNHVPPLARLAKILFALYSLGFVSLSFTALSGLMFARGSLFGIESHGALSLLGWLIYGVAIQGQRGRAVRARGFILLSLVGFLALALSLFEMHGGSH